jgi:putative FmdB family regulatory protein
MPVYEYRCQQCGVTSSFYLRTMAAPPPTHCRQCGSPALQRVFSPFAYLASEQDKLQKLDRKYHKRVEAALAKAPPEADPNHYLRQMVPFSAAKDTGGADVRE